MKRSDKVYLDILPESQRIMWKELSTTPSDFVLYGGTALALRFGHRISVDFDFFSNKPFDPEKLFNAIPYLQDSQVQQMAPDTLTCSVDRGAPVQVSFFGGLDLDRVKDPTVMTDNGVSIASALDVGAAKMKVVISRPAWKDYVDVDQLLQQGVSLVDMLSAAQSLYKQPYSPLFSLKALSYFDDIGPKLSKEGRERLLGAVKATRLDQIRTIPVRKGITFQ